MPSSTAGISSNSKQGRFVELYENRDQYQYGIEFQINSPAMFGKTTTGFFNVTGMKSMAREGGISVRNTELPQWIANAGLNFSLRKFDVNLYGNYSSDFYSTRFADKSAGTVALGDYVRMDLNAGYTFGTRNTFRLFLSARNLTDCRYSTVVGYPDPGRTLNVGINLRLPGRQK